MKKYLVELSTEQREELLHMISTGKAAARELAHARILLKADQGQEGPAWSDSRIQEALDRQCLSQRLASLEIATQQVAAWTARRNRVSVAIDWRFTAEDASIKLKHLYPSVTD